MRLFGLSIAIVLLSSLDISAQSIEAHKVFGGYKFEQDGKLLNLNELVTIMSENNNTSKLMKEAKSSLGMAQVISFIGGGLMGYPLGQSLGGGNPNWNLAGIGALITAIAIPISSGANKKMKSAVDIYNDGLNQTSHLDYKPTITLRGSMNSFGLVVTF